MRRTRDAVNLEIEADATRCGRAMRQHDDLAARGDALELEIGTPLRQEAAALQGVGKTGRINLRQPSDEAAAAASD